MAPSFIPPPYGGGCDHARLTATVYHAYSSVYDIHSYGRGISKSFGGHAVLDHVDLAVETGSVLALLGPNGAGKTTMVRILATLMRPDAGTATIAGHDLLTDPVGVKRSISLTGQYAAVDEMLTGRENLEMMAQLLRLSRRAARARAGEMLAEFDLADAARPAGGQVLRRHAAPPRPGHQHDRPAPAALPGRADHRAGPAQPRAAVEYRPAAGRRGGHGPADHPVPGGSRPARGHGRGARPRPGGGPGHARRAEGAAGRGGSPAAVRRSGRLRAGARRARPGTDRRPAAHHRRGHRGHGRRDLPDPGPAPGRRGARGQGVHLPPQPGRRVPVRHRHRHRHRTGTAPAPPRPEPKEMAR